MHVSQVSFGYMTEFMTETFRAWGVPEEEAQLAADVLIEADKRGISSHGIGYGLKFYLAGLHHLCLLVRVSFLCVGYAGGKGPAGYRCAFKANNRDRGISSRSIGRGPCTLLAKELRDVNPKL